MVQKYRASGWVSLRLALIFFAVYLMPSPLSAQSPVTGAGLVRGSLNTQYASHTFTLRAWDPDTSLILLLEYSPQGRWELDDRNGFFIFDQDGYDRFRAGAIPGSVSIAAGDRLPGTDRRLQATIGPPISSTFYVVVYNDSPVPMGYTLRATNGGLDDQGNQAYDGSAPAPASGGDAPVSPYIIVPGPTPVPVPTATPIPPLRASVVRGLLDARYAQDFFTLEVVDTGLPLIVEMTYDPIEQIRLIDSLNFWLFDEEQFRTQEISGSRPEFEPNRAAGQLIYRDEVPYWVTTIDGPLDRYMLVVNQHAYALSIGYRLSVQNGVLVDEGRQAQAVVTQPTQQPGVGNTIWIVRPGDTLGSIAQAHYGNRGYYAAICRANGLPNCNRLSPRQRLILPSLASLAAPQPSAPSASSRPLIFPTAQPAGGAPVLNNLLDVAGAESTLQTIRDLISETALDGTLASAGPYTLFAFTNQAFDALPVEEQDALLVDTDRAYALLANHMVQGRVNPEWVNRPKQIVALGGALLRLEPSPDGSFTVNGLPVTGQAIPAGNGLIYIVAGVLD